MAYGISRYDDISWGTKAVLDVGSTGVASQLRRAGQVARALHGFTRISRSEQALDYARRTKSMRASTSLQTTAASSLQVGVCLALALACVLLSSAMSHFLIYLGMALAAPSLIITLLSFLYFTSRMFLKEGGSCSTHAWNALNALGFLVILASTGFIVVDHGTSADMYPIAQRAFYGSYALVSHASAPACNRAGPHNLISPLVQLMCAAVIRFRCS